MKKHILIYGLCGGVLIVLLKLVEYRFLVIQHSIEIYADARALARQLCFKRCQARIERPNPICLMAAVFVETKA